MAHISLYRKYRPASFEEVVGQDHVTRTLANAIATGKVSHAYLFAGSRGTGKTSTAKLLAKALNCVEGPTATPCGKCESCLSIGSGTSLDVIEMDAASNRGIDDIREIRDRVAFAATVEGKFRVYILDEVHMLTKEASNAFLKVLEEPPEHVIFVLCTTEAHKVIPTIQSRCQRFEFRRPDAGMVLQVLERIVAAEGIEIDDAGLATIARGSGGAFRDAIGALDQLATYCEKQISLSDVLAMMGTVESELLFEAVDIVAAGDARGALLFVDRMAAQGRDFGQFAQELIGHLRNIFLLQQMDDDPAGVILLPEEDMHRLRGQARLLTTSQVLRFVDLLSDAYSWMRQGNEPRLQLELAFIRMTRPQVDMSTKSLLYRLEQLESREQTGSHGGSRPAAAPRSAQARPAEADTREAETSYDADEPDAAQDAGDTAPATQVSLDKINRAWSIIAGQVKKRKIPLFAVLQEGRPVELENGVLTIGFPAGAEFHKSQVEKPENLTLVTEVLQEFTGAPLRVICQVAEGMAPVRRTPPAEEDVPTTGDVIEMIKNDLGAEEIP